MPAAQTDWTVEMLDALPDDGQRYELIDGLLYVTPAPSYEHQAVAFAFGRVLHAYVRPSAVARASGAPSDVRKPNRTRNRVQPDVFVVRLTDGKRPDYPFDLADLLLAVEVESPSSTKLDYQVKRNLYLRNGIAEYWVVNPITRIVFRWRDADEPGEVFSGRMTWHPEGFKKPLVLDLPALFDDALG
ncbi:MAG TPA: Uma2 family endonuclease [Gemmatimonadaceae bacterium]